MRVTHLLRCDLQNLNDWGRTVFRMFDSRPYLVGSALDRADYRDVDVRIILSNKEYSALEKLVDVDRLGIVVSIWGKQVTGLPVDFQIQQRTHVNQAHRDKRAYPLGVGETMRGDGLG
jgi:hypothetical protein